MEPRPADWRMRLARIASAKPLLTAGLAARGAYLFGSVARPWFLYHGALVEDVDEALLASHSPRGWRDAWTRVAEARAAVARKAREEGARSTAFEHGVAAAVAFQVAPYLTPEERDDRIALLRRSAAEYRLAAPQAPWVVAPLTIPWEGHEMPAYLHLPPDSERPPVGVVVNAISHYKEMWTGLARDLVQRGIACLAFDAPGEGELVGKGHIPLQHERVTAAVLDALAMRRDVDAARAGILGLSIAGTLAARAAALDPRWNACVALSPAYDPSRYASWILPFLLEAEAQRTGLPAEEIVRRAEELSLAPLAPRITQPLLVVDAGKDHLLPLGEGRRLLEAAGSTRKEYVFVEDSDHAGVGDFHHVMARAADFLKESL